jgi:biopolymer transport protein ExbB/TolQ
MFINQDSVAVVFRFINFFTLIGLSFFLFKKYIKSDLLFLIAKKEAAHESLCTQQITLENQQRELDTLLKQETILCQDFRSKIDEWKKIVTLEHEACEKECNRTLAVVKKRTVEIAVHKENQRIQTVVSNAVTTNLEKSLSFHFKDTQQGTDYLDAIVHFMNERTS